MFRSETGAIYVPVVCVLTPVSPPRFSITSCHWFQTWPRLCCPSGSIAEVPDLKRPLEAAVQATRPRICNPEPGPGLLSLLFTESVTPSPLCCLIVSSHTVEGRPLPGGVQNHRRVYDHQRGNEKNMRKTTNTDFTGDLCGLDAHVD